LPSLARAITFGQLDTTNRFPHVGALIFESDGEPAILCSGTLIEPDVFLTAAHCTAFLDIGVAPDDVWVTFDQSSPLLPGTYHTKPAFGSGAQSNTNDIAVVTLDAPVDG
jgi:V8-like Glu-specific endopeptidase